MGRTNGILQRGGVLVVVLGCTVAPATSAHGAQITVPIVDVRVEIEAAPPAPTAEATPSAASQEPVIAATTGPTVPLVTDATTSDAPQPPPLVPTNESASSASEDPTAPIPPPESDVQFAAPLPAVPLAPVSRRHGESSPDVDASSRSTLPATETMAVTPPASGVATRTNEDADARRISYPATTTTIVPGQESPAIRATSQPGQSPVAVGGSGSAPSGIVPQLDAPSVRFPRQVVDDVDRPWSSHRPQLRIERPG